MHLHQSVLKDSCARNMFRGVSGGLWFCRLQLSLRWFLPFLVGLPPLLPCDMNSSRACFHCHLHHWHILHSLNTSGIRSSLCWVSHWANCCFAQPRYHLEQPLLFFLQTFIPHPWPIFMDSSMNSAWNSCGTLGFLTWPSSNFGLVTSQERVWCWSCPIGFAGFHFCGLQLEKGSSFPPHFSSFFSSVSFLSHIDSAAEWGCSLCVLLCVSFSFVCLFHLVDLFFLNMGLI